MFVMLLASILGTPCILKKRSIVLQRMIEKLMQHVIAAVSTSFEEDRDCLKTDHSTRSCSEPLIIDFDYETATNIIKFAASTMGDVYVLSLTCKKWNSIINKIPNTANPIWYKIARRFYGQKVFRRLESIDSGCKHDSNT